MKTSRISFATLMAVAVGTAAAQDATTTTKAADAATTRPWNAQDHFHVRVAAMREDIAALPADTTGTIVMLGDSITEHFWRTESMPETIHGVRVLNQGISGDQIDRPTSATGVTHRVDVLKEARPAVVFIMIGTNDFWGGKETPEEVIPQYDAMLRMVQDSVPEARLVLQSVLPTSVKHAHLNSNINALNSHIQNLASQGTAMYLDLHPLMEDAKGELKAEYTTDGVHLNKDAYAVWLKQLEELVPELLPKN